MMESRRRLLMTAVGALGFLAVNRPVRAEQTQGRNPPMPRVYPNGRDPNNPPSNDEPSHLDLKAIQQENQRKLRADVSKLYEMAADLKAAVEKTDSTSTLSVSLIKQAQEIEKLAKQIRSLARGLN
jgi:hypothetical protein